FDDFTRQPTLPKRLSQLGPGVCWCDLNGDGWDDLLIGGGKGGSLAVFLSDRRGGFQRSEGALAQPLTRDQTAIIAWPQASGPPAVLAGSAGYEDNSTNQASVLKYDLSAGTVQEAIPGLTESVGPLTLGDLDGDGNLDLFVGGRVVSGRYPEAVNSQIFRGHAGKFELDAANTKL